MQNKKKKNAPARGNNNTGENKSTDYQNVNT